MMRDAILVILYCSFLLSGCISLQKPYNIEIFDGGVEILSYLPKPCNYSDYWFPLDCSYMGNWDTIKDIKYTTITFDGKKINFALKKFVNIPPLDCPKPDNAELVYIEFDWNFSCENGILTTYWKIGENGENSIALGLSNLYSEYFGTEEEKWWETYGPKRFIRYWDGKRWGEKKPFNFSGNVLPLDIVRFYMQGNKSASSSVRYGAFFGIQTEKMLNNATAVCIEFVDGKTKTGFSWGNPNNFSTYNPLVFIDHCLWYEWDYNGTVEMNGTSFSDKKSHDFHVYSDIKKIEMNMTYNQSSMNLGLDDLDIVVYDAAGKKVAESRKAPGEAEEIVITNFSGLAFGNWRVEVESKNTIFEVEYNGTIRTDY